MCDSRNPPLKRAELIWMGGIEVLAEAISVDLQARLPGQRKTQREKLALLIATMLDVRSANLMDLAASLPRPSEQPVMRYQWIKRLLANALVDSDAVMAPYGREMLARIAAGGETLVLMIDQTQATELHQAVMVAVRVRGRALPLAWGGAGSESARWMPRARAKQVGTAPRRPPGRAHD